MPRKICVNSTNCLGVDTPLGKMYMTICAQGLHGLGQCEEISDENFEPNLSQPVCLVDDPESFSEDVGNHATDCINWLKFYFNDLKSLADKRSNSKYQFPYRCNDRCTTVPCLCFTSSEERSFRERVWLKLAESVGPGETITYGALAALMGNVGAARAVGTAMAHNPFQLIVPCHRVVRSDAAVGKYALGRKNSVKHWLLEHEGVIIDSKGNIKTQ